MSLKKLPQIIKDLMPALTASVAFIAIVVSLLGFINLSLSEGIMLTVLGLLAIDALLERRGVLGNILSNTVSVLNIMSKSTESRPVISWENELLQKQPLDLRLDETKELFISGGSLIGLMSRQGPLIQRWLENNESAKLLLILENPETAEHGTTPVWSSAIDKSRKAYAEDIRRTLLVVKPWQNKFPDSMMNPKN